MPFLGDVYDWELSRYGVTFCDELADGDRLVIAPRLRGHPDRFDAVRIYPSHSSKLDYLRIGSFIVGVAYLNFSYCVRYYMNGFVPNNLSTTLATDISVLCVDEPEAHGRLTKEEVSILKATYQSARNLASSPLPIPPEVIDRIRDCIPEKMIRYSYH